MTDKVENIGFRDLSVEASDSNRVLRNTYWLLTLTLLPTVLGAWFGIASGVSYYLSGGLGLVFFLAGTFGFVYAIEKNKDSSLGIVFLLEKPWSNHHFQATEGVFLYIDHSDYFRYTYC